MDVMRPPLSKVLGAVAGAVVLVSLAAASGAAAKPARSAAGGLTRLLPPPDGKAYFGFTFRLWDSSDPVYGDSRPFAARIQDSIQTELAGKTPTTWLVWAGLVLSKASPRPGSQRPAMK